MKKSIHTTAILLLVIILVVSSIPYFFAYRASGDDVFLGVIKNVMDANNHLSFIRQTSQGNLLVGNDLTWEEVPALLFNPLHILMGWTSWLLGGYVMASYHVWRIILLAGAVYATVWFVDMMVPSQRQRVVASFAIWLSGGFGFVWTYTRHMWSRGLVPYDVHLLDLLPFHYVHLPHFLAAYVLMILAIGLYYRYVQTGCRRFLYMSAIITLVLGFVHIFEMIIVYALIALSSLMRLISSRDIRVIGDGCLFVLLSIPSLLYTVYLFSGPYASWTSANILPSPHLHMYLSALGVGGIGALMWMWYALRRDLDVREQIVICWIVASIALAYSPLGFQRRLLFGLYVPLIIAAVWWAAPWIDGCKRCARDVFVGGVIFIFLIGTPVLVTIQDSIPSRGPPSLYANDIIISQDYHQALLWMAEHLTDEHLVFSSLASGNYIGRFSDARVFLGHWAQTRDFDEHMEQFRYFGLLNATQRKEFMEHHQITHVFFGPHEQHLSFDDPWLTQLATFQSVVVYAVS